MCILLRLSWKSHVALDNYVNNVKYNNVNVLVKFSNFRRGVFRFHGFYL